MSYAAYQELAANFAQRCRARRHTEEEQQREGGIEYNYRREPAWQMRDDGGMANRMEGNPVADNAAMAGTDVATYIRERPGMSAFALEDGVVYHTYYAFARGLDVLWGM